MESAELSMLYAGMTADDCRAWQNDFRAKLNELLGDSKPPQSWTAREVSSRQFPDHVSYELLREAGGVPSLPVYLLLPDSKAATRRHPAAVCVDGHRPFGNDPIDCRTDLEGIARNIEQHNYDYGLEFVRRGYTWSRTSVTPKRNCRWARSHAF